MSTSDRSGLWQRPEKMTGLFQNASFTPTPDLINERQVLGTAPYPASAPN